MRRFCLFLPTLAISFSLCATELLPWFGKTLEIETRAAGQLQSYRSVAANRASSHRPACDLFLDLSAATTYKELAAEIEAIASHSRYRSVGMDCLKLTGRYRWMNDILGDDPFSLVSGVSISQVFKPGRRNLSSFHHGGIEGEIHLAAGKEQSFLQFWTSRYWAVVGLGVADIGSPWLRGDIAWEHNYCDLHQIRLFANSLWGLGHNNLNLHSGFHGYGPIKHQSIDVGFRYSKFSVCGVTISLEYAYRAFARNCPKAVNIVYVSLFYPCKL